METSYTIEQPSDFSGVIDELLNWHSKNKSETALVITLSGELGAGKTTFTQELGKTLGVTEHITSPTFTIMKQYHIEHEHFDQLVHIDAYRIEDESEVGPLKLAEIFTTPRTIVCIEWSEQIPSVLPKERVEIKIEIIEGDKRKVQMYSNFPS